MQPHSKIFAAIIGVLALVVSDNALGQMHFITDTVELGGITVETSRQQVFSVGSRQLYSDTLPMQLNEGKSVEAILLQMAPLNIKSYGTSGAAGMLSVRGAGGSRTQIAWNGMPLNSLTLGDVNLSLISSDAFDQVHIDYSAPSTLYGSNAFGGVVDLLNTPCFNSGINLSVQQQAGSFNTFRTGINAQIGGEKVAIKATAWHFSSDNNFWYYDEYYSQYMNRANANHTQSGAVATGTFRVGVNQMVTAGIWAQQNETGIPPVNGSNPRMMVSTQNDHTLKSYVKWSRHKNNLLLWARTFVFYDYMLYRQKLSPADEVYSIDSDIITLQNETEFSARYTLNRFITADAGGSFRHNVADGVNFSSRPSENRGALFSAAKFSYGEFLASLSVRKELSTRYDPPVRFGFGTQYSFLQNSVTVRFAANQKYRMPTFNDKYWPTGGDPDIKPETGTTYEGGVGFLQQWGSHSVAADVTAYWLDIHQMIAWVPEGALWRPRNYSRVNSKGVENSATYKFTNEAFFVSNKVAFELNQSREQGAQYQLRYTPKYRASNVLSVGAGRISGMISAHYLGRRQIDETYFTLPEHFSVNSSVQYRFNHRNVRVTLLVQAENLTNHTRPLIKDYPLPGTSVMGGIKLQYVDSKENK